MCINPGTAPAGLAATKRGAVAELGGGDVAPGYRSCFISIGGGGGAPHTDPSGPLMQKDNWPVVSGRAGMGLTRGSTQHTACLRQRNWV